MNFNQFKQTYFKEFNRDVRLRKVASKIKVEVEQAYRNIYIEAFDEDECVGNIIIEIREDQQELYVYIVIVKEEYKNSSVGMKMFREFKKLYDEQYNGWVISAEFYNEKLSQVFNKMIERGKFPEGINKTEVVEMNEEEYDEWEQSKQQEYFGEIPMEG